MHKIDPRVMCKGEEAICSPFFAGAVVSEVALLCRIYCFRAISVSIALTACFVKVSDSIF